MRILCVAGFVLALTSAGLAAQERKTPDQTPLLMEADGERLQEIHDWYPKAKEWYKWASLWFNKTRKTAFGVAKRKEYPTPPEWLTAYCRAEVAQAYEEKLFRQACELLRDIENLIDGEPVNLQTQFEKENYEKPDKHSKWPERIHLDTLYVMTQTGRGAPFAYAGMHMTIYDVGRVQFFIPPGFLLLSIPYGNGRMIRPAYDWGISIRLKEFHLPGSKNQMVAHFNVVKVWMHGGSDEIGARSGMDMAGLSFTWKNPKIE